MPVDTNADLPVTVASRGEDFLDLEFGFAPGAGVLKAGTGEWSLAGGALVARVFGGGAAGVARPFAVYDGPTLMAADLVVTASVTVDPTPPTGHTSSTPPRAEVLLRGDNGARLGVGVRLGAQPGYFVSLRQPGGEPEEERKTAFGGEVSAPAAGVPLRMRLTAENGEISVFLGADEPMKLAFKKRLEYARIEGAVALSCVEATCRFDKLIVAGRPSQVRPPPVEPPRP